MDYTHEQVLEACEKVKEKIKEKKNRESMDMRNYLIGLLYFKFIDTEETIASIFGIDRCSVNHAKVQPYNFLSLNDISFIANVAELMNQFPYDFPKTRDSRRRLNTAIIVYLDSTVMKKMDLYMMVKSIKRKDVAAKELITKALKLWEE